MTTIALTSIFTILLCVAITKHYTIMTMSYTFHQHKGYKHTFGEGYLRDARSGLKIADITADSCDSMLRFASGETCVDQCPSWTVLRVPRLLHGIPLPSRKDHPRLLLKRRTYKNLLQYASGYKKMPESHACC